MDYYCEVCNIVIKPKSRSKHFKSINHKVLDKRRHIKLTINNDNIDNIDKIFYTYNNEYDNKYEYYLIRCESKLCFNNMKDYPIASSKLTDNKTMDSWKIFVENVIDNFKNEGFDFSRISQINIIIVCNKMDMTYDFYMKHNMQMI